MRYGLEFFFFLINYLCEERRNLDELVIRSRNAKK